MPFSLRKLSKLNLIALCIIALIGIAAFGFGFRDWFSRPAPIAVTQQQIRPEATAAPDGVIQLLLRPEGFDSPKLTVTKGTYILILLNRTGEKNLALQVSRLIGNGEKPKDIAFDDDKKKYQVIDAIDLTPGDYVVSVQDHPEWTSRVIATSK